MTQRNIVQQIEREAALQYPVCGFATATGLFS